MATLNKVPGVTYAGTPAFSRYNDAIVLGTAAAVSWTAPDQCSWVIIEPTDAVWGNLLGTAVVPVANVTDGSASQRMSTPYQIRIAAGEVLSLIRAGSSSVTVSIAVYSD